MEDNNHPTLLNHDEAMQFLRSVTDPITNQLMNMANAAVLTRFFEGKDLPVSDFDLLFFLEVVKQFSSQHDSLQRILAGEDLRAWTDEEP